MYYDKYVKKKQLKKKRLKSLFGILWVSILLLILLIVFKKQNAELCANSISCIQDLTGIYKGDATSAEFLGKTFFIPKYIANNYPIANVLGNTTGEKRIEVNLSNQHLYAYEGDNLVYDFPVSTGKWYPTPTGTFHIWIKLRYTSMVGGNKAWGTYYNLPNVPYTMYFYSDSIPKTRGFGLHGTYWHNNFGHPMSHGCVNVKTEDVEKLYYWADPPTKNSTTYADNNNPGTKIVIYGETPKE